MKPRLISFKLCPFVQRAVLMLIEKQVDHEITYIDLASKPDWFLELSPRGKVPVLIADEVPLFESQAICEYLEESFPTLALMPQKLVHRARDRAWFAYAAEDLFLPLHQLTVATDAKVVDDVRGKLRTTLTRLETEMAGRDWLSGDGARFGMADVAVAPFFLRASLITAAGGPDLLKAHPQLTAWSRRLLARPSLQRSVPPDFEVLFVGGLKEKKSAILTTPL